MQEKLANSEMNLLNNLKGVGRVRRKEVADDSEYEITEKDTKGIGRKVIFIFSKKEKKIPLFFFFVTTVFWY